MLLIGKKKEKNKNILFVIQFVYHVSSIIFDLCLGFEPRLNYYKAKQID